MLGWEGEFELMVSIALSLALKGGGGGIGETLRKSQKMSPQVHFALAQN